jgi:hypothetical protein
LEDDDDFYPDYCVVFVNWQGDFDYENNEKLGEKWTSCALIENTSEYSDSNSVRGVF